MCALVTGVQTCALPISAAGRYSGAGPDLDGAGRVQHGRRPPDRRARADRKARRQSEPLARCAPHLAAAVAESLVFTDATWLCTRTSGGALCRQHSLELRHAGLDHTRKKDRAEERKDEAER